MRVTREEMAKDYRQKLTEQVKAVGQELIDRADDLVGNGGALVGNGGAISDFAIMLYFEQDSMPKIKLLREHLSMRCIDMEVQGGDD